MDVAVLNRRLQNLWEEYNHVRLLGQKKEANNLLAVFINELRQQDQAEMQHFVDALCTAVLDTNDEVLANNGVAVANQVERIQHPLFKDILLPILAKQYLQNSSRHMKWIGQLEQFFYTDAETTSAFLQQIHYEGFFEAAYFFEKAFAISQEQDALTLLLHQLAKTMDYYFHEVPYGVLATPHVLQEALQRFKHYWSLSQHQRKWTDHFIYWERLTYHWTCYNSDSNSYNNFAHYLSLHNILPD